MGWRSKSNKEISQTNTELIAAEAACLKALNSELAKSISDSKTLITQLNDEIHRLQKELLDKNILIRKLTNCVSEIRASALTSINYTKDILNVANRVQHINSNVTNTNFSPQYVSNRNNKNKTHAVKPMVGGHVILRPTINLRRINEISLGEYQSLTGLQSRSSEQNQSEQVEIEDSSNNNESENVLNNSVDLLEADSNNLVTLQEDDHLDSSNRSVVEVPNNTRHPILSGVFQDVRVYLSPQADISRYLASSSESRRKKSPRERNVAQPSTSTSNQIELEASTSTRVNRTVAVPAVPVRFEPQPSTSRAEEFVEIQSSGSNSTGSSFQSASSSNESDTPTEQIKVQTLKSLGLIPTSIKHNVPATSQTLSSASAVLKRRRTKEDAPNKIAFVAKRKSKLLVEKSLRITRSKKAKVETVKAVRAMKKKAKKAALRNVKKAAKKDKLINKLKKLKTKKRINGNSVSEIAGTSSSSAVSVELDVSPKKLRAKRGPKEGTFKEPSLKKKLRR